MLIVMITPEPRDAVMRMVAPAARMRRAFLVAGFMGRLSPDCPLVSLGACRFDVGVGCKRLGRDRPSRAVQLLPAKFRPERDALRRSVPADSFFPGTFEPEDCSRGGIPARSYSDLPARALCEREPRVGRHDTTCAGNSVAHLGFDSTGRLEFIPGLELAWGPS